MGQPLTKTLVLAAAASTAVCAAQTASGAGFLLINGTLASGGVATMDVARRIVASTSSASDNGKKLVLIGTDRMSNPIIETLTLNSTTAPYTKQDFLTVISASISAATTGTVSVGTNGVASTTWIPTSYLTEPFNVGYSVELNGVTCNFTVETTEDEISKSVVDMVPGGCGDSSFGGLSSSTFVPPVAFPALASQTADVESQILIPCKAVRLTVNSGATAGAIKFEVQQDGIFG